MKGSPAMAPQPAAPPHELEADLETFFYKRVKACGGIILKLVPTRAGIPDRLVLLPGGAMRLVELKTYVGERRLIQRVWHDRAAAIGVQVDTLRGRGEILSWLRRYLDESGGFSDDPVGVGTRSAYK